MSSKIKNIVITGGGTGGHIYPGLAIAQEIEALYPNVKIHFVGARGGLEEKIVVKTHYPLHLIKMDRLHRSVGVLRQLKTLCLMPFSLLSAVFIFRKIRPDAVLGVGGFASGPFLLISWLMKAKTALWEANAYPGMANRWLSGLVNRCYLVFKEAAPYLKSNDTLVVGMPVRKEFFAVKNKPRPPSAKLRVLVFGGSQGARAINNAILEMVTTTPDILEKIDLKHQTGVLDYKRIKSAYQNHLDRVIVNEYIYDMPEEFHWADVIICRSGASTVAEVMTCCKPAIFIPLPTAADNHQFKNAQVLAVKKAAILIEQKALSTKKLQEILLHLEKNRPALDEMAENLKSYDFSNSAQKVARDLLEGKL